MASGGTTSGGPVTVLHVDPDTDVPETLAETLETREGSFEVVSETASRDALDRLGTVDVDCVVSEYTLRDTNGVELLGAVRERDATLPFVMFTGDGDEGIASRAVSAGVTDYIRKQSEREGIDALATRIQSLGNAGQSVSETNTRYDSDQFERFLEAFPDAVFVMDENGRYLDYITGGDRSLLYDDVDELLGRRYHDVLPDDTADRFLDTIREALDTGDQQQIEYRLDVKRGERWFEARVGPLDTGSEPRTVFWIARDVTERKRREQEYEQIFNGVPDPLTVNDPETGELLEVNDALCETLGYEKETILQKGNDGLAVNDEGFTGERAADIVRHVMESGEPQTFEWKLEAADGSHRVLEVTGTPAEINGEERYISLTRDITERRQREREYEQIFDSVNDAITVFDPTTGEIVDVNETYHEMLGYDDLETIRELGIEGLSASDEGYTGERGRELVREVSKRGEPETVEWRGETSDGERLWLEATLAPAEIGGQERVLSIQRDITERKRRKREYEQIFDSVNDIIAVHDRDTGELLDVNRRMCELTGYDKETVLELGAPGLVHDHPAQEYGPEEIPGIIDRVMDGEEIDPYEQALETSDGGFVWVEVNPTRAVIGGEERFVAISRDVTERRRRELEYEQIFDNVNDIIAVRDPETGEIIDANQPYADLLGYDREEMQGMTISDVGVPDEGYDEEQGMEHLRAVVESDDPVEFEWKVEGADGRSHLMDVRGTAALINGEQRYLAIGRDITERKRRERAINSLRKATERLQSATTPEDVATVAVETASEVLDLPMAVCWLHDDDADRLEPAAATDGVHEAELAAPLSADRYEYDVFREGAVTEYTPREQSEDSTLETGVLLPLADHGLIAAAARGDARADGTVIDIAKALADHVTTALDRVERGRAVRESERRFRLIADRVDEIIYLADADTGEVLYLSPGYEEIWGYSLDDIYDDPRAFTRVIHPEDIDAFTAAREQMFADIEAGDPDDSYEFAYRIERPDGELRWIETSGYPILGDGDRPNRYVALIEDVTERKYREQRLEVFNRILRHNLRNQLDVIRSHAEVLADRATDDHAERIIAAVDELAAIGARARNIDRVMSMGDTLAEVSLSDTLREAAEEIDATRGDVSVTTELPGSAPLKTTEQAVQTAVESALENAVEHAESTVTVTVEECTDGYAVTISDDGPGIPEDELVPIEARTETHLRHGRGLGLWQLRWSVDKLNGELSFDTDGGTTVRITIPDQREATRTD